MSASSTLPRTEGVAAFKEWAVSCAALGQGSQVMIFRKGGIREKGRQFTVDHPAFFLYPTYEHQDAASVKPEWQGLLSASLEAKPDLGQVRISYWAKVAQAWGLESMEPVLRQEANHIYSAQSVRDRWEWHPEKPLWLLLLRVYRLETPLDLEVLEDYTGCKSWIDLGLPESARSLPCVPVLDDAAFARKALAVSSLLG